MNNLFTEESVSCPEYRERYKISQFNLDLEVRRRNFPYTKVLNYETVQQLKTDGLSLVRNVFDSKKVRKLKQKFDQILNLEKTSQHKGIIKRTEIHRTLSGDLALLNFPEIIEYVCSDVVYDVASGFYGCTPLFSWCKIHKTLPSGSRKPFGTQFFHFDSNSLCNLKAFLYLEDVSDSHQGPFTYVKGSHLNRFENWNKLEKRPSMWRFYDEQIQEHYSDKITPVFANAGDVIFANTSGFHKAGQVAAGNSRHMLTLHFLIHPEFRRSRNHFMPIRRGIVDNLLESHKPLFQATREI